MVLKPQDIVVTLKLLQPAWAAVPYSRLAAELGMSPSEVHAAVQRACAAGLMDPSTRSPNREALGEFLVHGLRYAFPPEHGVETRGMPTGIGAEPLASHFTPSNDSPPIWPSPNGSVRGQALEPLYRSVPEAASRDPDLYALLALVDAIRAGRTRERKLAERELLKRLKRDAASPVAKSPVC